jgi:hypothetical protein
MPTSRSGRHGPPHQETAGHLEATDVTGPAPGLAASVLTVYGATLPSRLADAIAAAMMDVPVDFGGGCSVLKGLVLASLIVDRQMTLAVEIGVYRGRSLVPQALAFKALGAGRAVGIDPYCAAEARQTDNHEAAHDSLETYALETDWDGVYLEMRDRLVLLGVADRCELRRSTSHAAAASFEDGSVDMLHIDGNHDLAAVADDLRCYLPKLKRNALLVMDDASWRAIRPALDTLDQSLERLFTLDDRGLGRLGTSSDFVIYRMP